MQLDFIHMAQRDEGNDEEGGGTGTGLATKTRTRTKAADAVSRADAQ